jgi:hypothetical protein
MKDTLLEKPRLETRRLRTIKLLHTAIWAFFVACIVGLPLAGFLRRFDWALILTALILVECGVLAVNGGRCPLTDVAARFSPDRHDAFDIYLPGWLARRNRVIFGSIFVLGELFVLWERLR